MTRCDHAPDRFGTMRGEIRRSIESYPQIEPVKHLQQGFQPCGRNRQLGLQIDLTASFERKIEFFDIETECYCHTPKAIRKKFFSSRTNTSPDIFDMTTPSRNVVSTSSIRNPLLRSASMINSVSNKKSGMRVRRITFRAAGESPFRPPWVSV